MPVPSNATEPTDYSLIFPEDFDDYEWEVTAKGWFSGSTVVISGKHYLLNIYDTARLSQEIEQAVLSCGVFFEPNLLIVQSVDRREIEKAVEILVQSGQMSSLVPE